MLYIVDLVSLNANASSNVISSISKRLVPGDQVTYVAGFTQALIPAEIGDAAILRVLESDLRDDKLFVARLFEGVVSARAEDTEVSLASYLTRLQTAFDAQFAQDDGAHFLSLEVETAQTKALTWDPAFMTERRAALVLASVVADHPDQAAPQTALRTALGNKDSRFARTSGIPFSVAPRFISAVVEVGVRAGFVEIVESAKPGGTPLIALTAAGAQALSTTAALPAATRPTPEIETTEHEPVNVDKAQLWLILLRHNFGPFQQVRGEIYDDLELLARNNPGYDAMKVVRKAVGSARVRYVTPAGRSGLPWGKVQEFMKVLLRRERVLLSGVEFVEPLYGPGHPVVDGIVDDFRQRLDCSIVLHLLEIGAEIEYDDEIPLAATLYDSLSEANQDRAQTVLNRIIQDGTASVDARSGQIVLATPPSLEAALLDGLDVAGDFAVDPAA
ncbi:MAG: hypothetical protein JWQ19_1818 [Subtercola sp.]|nr:hypothetical protein [Subtercola sp.]